MPRRPGYFGRPGWKEIHEHSACAVRRKPSIRRFVSNVGLQRTGNSKSDEGRFGSGCVAVILHVLGAATCGQLVGLKLHLVVIFAVAPRLHLQIPRGQNWKMEWS